MFVRQILLVQLHILIFSVSCEVGPYRPIPDTARICLATYIAQLDNELLLGTWYNVYHFASWSNLPPSGECREIEFIRPTQQEIERYKAVYNLTGMPYSFEEDAIIYNDRKKNIFSGLILGKREAKFFLYNLPKLCIHSESYDVVLIRYINDNYILFEQCMMRGSSKWLMSKSKHPSDEDLEKIIASQSDLMSMQNQKYCAIVPDPSDFD